MTNKQNKNKKPKQPVVIKFNFMWFWAAIVIAIIAYSFFGTAGTEPLKSNTTAITELIRKGEVERIVVINKSDAKVYLTDQAIESYTCENRILHQKIPPLSTHMAEKRGGCGHSTVLIRPYEAGCKA